MSDLLNELSNEAKSKLERVPRNSTQYIDVMLHLGNLDVLSVYKIANEHLDMQYAVAVSAVNHLDAVRVLHGTSTQSIDAIIRHGFKVGGQGVPVRNGTVHGAGVYLTTDPKLAASYARRFNCKYLLMSQLCRTYQCVTKGEASTHNSLPVVENTTKRHRVYVQPEKDLVRPLYVVEFGEQSRPSTISQPIPKQPPLVKPPLVQAAPSHPAVLQPSETIRSSSKPVPQNSNVQSALQPNPSKPCEILPNDSTAPTSEPDQQQPPQSSLPKLTTISVIDDSNLQDGIKSSTSPGIVETKPNESCDASKAVLLAPTGCTKYMESIPEELTKLVFGNLDGHDLARVREVCRSWHFIASQEALWKTICVREWQALETDAHLLRIYSKEQSWRKVYPKIYDTQQFSFTLKKNTKFICRINARNITGHHLVQSLPETIQVTRRFNDQHLQTFILPDADFFYFEPKTEADEDGYQGFIEYLQKRRRAGLALIEHARVIFICPGEYLRSNLLYEGNRIIGVIQYAYPPLAP